MKSSIVFILHQLLFLAAVSCEQFPQNNPHDPVNMEDMDSSVTDAGIPNIIIFERDNEPSIVLLDQSELPGSNNGNGKIEAGETIRLSITLQNEGTQRAEDVRATPLTRSSDRCIKKSEIVDANGVFSSHVNYSNIEPGQLSNVDHTYFFQVTFSRKCTPDEPVDLTVEVTDNKGRFWDLPLQLTPNKPINIEDRDSSVTDAGV